MIATKFEPHDNWLPPCYYVPRDLEKALIQAGLPACHWNSADLPSLRLEHLFGLLNYVCVLIYPVLL